MCKLNQFRDTFSRHSTCFTRGTLFKIKTWANIHFSVSNKSAFSNVSYERVKRNFARMKTRQKVYSFKQTYSPVLLWSQHAYPLIKIFKEQAAFMCHRVRVSFFASSVSMWEKLFFLMNTNTRYKIDYLFVINSRMKSNLSV